MRVHVLVCLIALTAAPALAQEAPLTRVYACTDVVDATARLACFDAAVAGLKQQQAGGDLAVVSRQQVQKVEKEAFGLSVPSASELVASAGPASAAPAGVTAPARSEKARPLDRVSLGVKSVSKGADGKAVITMDNGQVWKQTDTTKLKIQGKGPWTAEVRKAALGSYMLSVDDRPSIRVKRVE